MGALEDAAHKRNDEAFRLARPTSFGRCCWAALAIWTISGISGDNSPPNASQMMRDLNVDADKFAAGRRDMGID